MSPRVDDQPIICLGGEPPRRSLAAFALLGGTPVVISREPTEGGKHGLIAFSTDGIAAELRDGFVVVEPTEIPHEALVQLRPIYERLVRAALPRRGNPPTAMDLYSCSSTRSPASAGCGALPGEPCNLPGGRYHLARYITAGMVTLIR